ncbi:hypothetical protein [Sinomicrobium weinanense]|uniref:Uncharacterized protein n=1 Tax=Sinomicrobium weinanense TaxID=2842200 RepID=A0A926JVB7_9FLAO|nr:hypothetical protein [Sinomicrobium weinanense]MBC9797868.1 hypothetical protein [Sinomicrobium weinanense]MBU3122232.1 hypothetical protein [Sinomicrobium weinanense]
MDLSKKTDRMDIVIEPQRQTILVQQRWKYDWQTVIPLSNWTYDEKKEFHHQADKLIWNQWGGHFFIKIEGSSDFAKKAVNREFTVNFDLKWVLSNEHWRVVIRKIPKGGFKQSKTNWTDRKILLDSEDVASTEKMPGFFQHGVSHEFGHAIGNVPNEVNHWDEYRTTSSYYRDLYSIMNVGSELRERHLDYLVRELNTMIPETTFSINKLQ